MDEHLETDIVGAPCDITKVQFPGFFVLRAGVSQGNLQAKVILFRGGLVTQLHLLLFFLHLQTAKKNS